MVRCHVFELRKLPEVNNFHECILKGSSSRQRGYPSACSNRTSSGGLCHPNVRLMQGTQPLTLCSYHCLRLEPPPTDQKLTEPSITCDQRQMQNDVSALLCATSEGHLTWTYPLPEASGALWVTGGRGKKSVTHYERCWRCTKKQRQVQT